MVKSGVKESRKRVISVERRKQILDAALNLFYEKGYSQTKVNDIAHAAGVSKGLIFHYFPTKLDIFKALDGDIDNFIQLALEQDTPTKSIKNLVSILCNPKVVDPAKLYILTFLRGELAVDMPENIVRNRKIFHHVLPVVKEGQRRGEFRDGDPEELTKIYLHFFLGVFSSVMLDKGLSGKLPNMELAFELLLKR